MKTKRIWWAKNEAVTHNQYGHGVVTNFVGCQSGNANVYFYRGDCVREVSRRDCKRAGNDWSDGRP